MSSSKTSAGSSRSQQHQSAGQIDQTSPLPGHPQRRRLSNPPPSNTNINDRRGSNYHQHINTYHNHPSVLEPPFSYAHSRASSPRHHSTTQRASNPSPQTTSPSKAPTSGPSAALSATTLQLLDDRIPAFWSPDNGVDGDIVLPRLHPPIESSANELGWPAGALDHFYTSSDSVHNHLSDFAGQDFSSPSTYPRFTTASDIPSRDTEVSSASVHNYHHHQLFTHPEGQLLPTELDLNTPSSASTSTSNLLNSSTCTSTTAISDSHSSTTIHDTLADSDIMPPRTRRSSVLLAESIALESDQHVGKRQRTTEQPPRGFKKEPHSQPAYKSAPNDDPFADLEEEDPGAAKREDGGAPLMIDLTETPAVAKDEKPPGEPEVDHRIKLGAFQCVICMDNVTTLTVTYCGHLFCAQCLHSSLHVDTLNKGKCPMCRTKIDMKARETYNSKTKGVWPLELKLMTARRKGKRKADGMA